MTAADFEALKAEAAAAKVARDEAEARYRAASDALRAAQCWVRYDSTTVRGIPITHHYCTLQKNHNGDHGKASA